MDRPNIANQLFDPKTEITYKVMAYRNLTNQEIVSSVTFYHSQKGRKRLKKGDVVIIETIIGHND